MWEIRRQTRMARNNRAETQNLHLFFNNKGLCTSYCRRHVIWTCPDLQSVSNSIRNHCSRLVPSTCHIVRVAISNLHQRQCNFRKSIWSFGEFSEPLVSSVPHNAYLIPSSSMNEVCSAFCSVPHQAVKHSILS